MDRRCSDQFAKPRLEGLGAFGEGVALPWLQSIYSCESQAEKEAAPGGCAAVKATAPSFYASCAAAWRPRVAWAVHEAFCLCRIRELYNCIAEFPDSAVAVVELRQVEPPPPPAALVGPSFGLSRGPLFELHM